MERYRHSRLDKWNVVQSWIVQVIRRFLIKRVEQREWQMKEKERERETSEISDVRWDQTSDIIKREGEVQVLLNFHSTKR